MYAWNSGNPHAFTWCDNLTRIGWQLCCPALLGFVIISAWFGIHFKWMKIVRLLGVVAYCVVASAFLRGGVQFVGYWYVWAYIFMMMFSPIVDEFVEQCTSRKVLLTAFASVSVLVWVWAFLSSISPTMKYLPKVLGFGNCSGVVLLCVYVLTRILKRLGCVNWFGDKWWRLACLFIVSSLFVINGFRHTSSVFAFGYALSILLVVKKLPVHEGLGRIFTWLGPSMFSVYLLHMPFHSCFPRWEQTISEIMGTSHWISQIVLALCVFIACVVIDMPRRIVVHFCRVK